MYLIIWSFGICLRHTFLSGINTRNNHWHLLFPNSIFKLRPRLIFSLACNNIKSIQSVSGCCLMLTACIMVIFLGKAKTTEAHEYAYNITWVLIFYQLWWYVTKISQIGMIQGVKWWIWAKIIHFDCIQVIFLEKLKTTEAHEYA